MIVYNLFHFKLSKYYNIEILLSFSDELTITQPSFTSSVGGYSSYLAYPVEPRDVVKEIEVQFHFTAEVTGNFLNFSPEKMGFIGFLNTAVM